MSDITGRYLAEGETWLRLADRVANIMQYSDEVAAIRSLIQNKEFIPNSPALIFAGRPGGRNLMACHVLEVPNSIDGIMRVAGDIARVFKSGGGIGLDLSQLSSEGTQLKYSSGGVASGPVSFLYMYDAVAHCVIQGGLRRAAMMATLSADHPDILDFINCKQNDGVLGNFNISVTIKNGPDSIPSEVWDAIVKSAHKNGEPGVVFLDNVNRDNPLREEMGDITAVNACAEQPLYDYGSCCLGHLVLPRLITKPGDYAKLKHATRLAVRFLDRVIDVNHYPMTQVSQLARDIRNIGLGVMGWADLLKANGILFVSDEAFALAEEVGTAIRTAAIDASWELATQYGGYRRGKRRNSFLTTIAPTGHTSRLAGVQNSIYPPYAVGLLMSPEEHIELLKAWAAYSDSAISYTVSFPNGEPPEYVCKTFRLAYEAGLKCMAVYRDGSREGQPCVAGECGV